MSFLTLAVRYLQTKGRVLLYRFGPNASFADQNPEECSMNTSPTPKSYKAGIVTAIGVLVLLLGTATGNAYALLALSLIGLAVIGIFLRHELGRSALLVMFVAAAIAVTVGFAMAGL
jgi:hypothetical protein